MLPKITLPLRLLQMFEFHDSDKIVDRRNASVCCNAAAVDKYKYEVDIKYEGLQRNQILGIYV